MNVRPNSIKVWPHLTLVFLVCAVAGGVAAALWVRHEPKAEALALPRAARVERVDGEVGLSRDLNADADDESTWQELTPNTPLTTGDRVYVRDNSNASLAFTGRNFATVYPDSALDVVSLDDRRTQLALRRGSAIFDVGALQPGELYEVATPYGAVDFQQPGLYQVGYNDDGSAFVSVLSGLAQVVGLAGSGQISKGEMLTLLGQTAAQVALSRLSPDYAGGLLDDYYGYRYPDYYDGRYADYNAYLNDPYYYDPYNRYQSYRYVPSSVPGAYDLDYYGDWQNLNGYGYAWSPRVDQGWAPYRDGYWMTDDPYGLTWVSNEPWGYAPYHYGRWVSAGDRWYWVPDSVNTQPAYAPALVAFLPAAGANEIGWVPLAPGDPYAPAYYDADWQPHYYGDNYYAPERVVNMNVPGALTVVSVDQFGNRIDRNSLARFDPRAFNDVRPVLEPFSNALLRQTSLKHAHANERRGFVLPPGLAKKLDATQVYASAPPPRFRDNDVARRFHVDTVPEKQKREKMKFDDKRQQPAQAAPVVRGFEEVRGRGRDVRRAEKAEQRAASGHDSWTRPVSPQAERVAARAEERARGERAAQQRQAQAAQAANERQQRAAEQQQRFEARRQAEANAHAQRQAEQQQRAQQAAAQRAQQQQEMMRARQAQQQQRQAQQQQRRMERPQQQQRPAMQAPPGQSRQQQAPAGGPPSDGGGGRGQGQGNGGGKGRGKH